MKILVTGASGFVGGAFVKRFGGRYGIVIHGVGRRKLDDANYSAVDLSEPFDVPFEPDVVIHAAARAAPWGTKREFVRQNVDATRNVIAFCERKGRPRLVYVSSSAVFYRNEDQLDLTEESPIGPRFVNAYAATKYAGEELVRAYAGPWMIVRPRAVFGPGDTVVFPRIVRAARSGRLPLIKRNGPPARADLIYIDTLSDYLMAAARTPLSGCVNVTNGEPVETEPFLLEVFARLGIPAPERAVDARVARAAAAAVEGWYRLFRPRDEPPITCFGVSALAYSKTFDVSKMLRVFGPPSVSVQRGVDEFVASLALSAA
jgi:nucleoside-diphosphate-sugar epimerase